MPSEASLYQSRIIGWQEWKSASTFFGQRREFIWRIQVCPSDARQGSRSSQDSGWERDRSWGSPGNPALWLSVCLSLELTVLLCHDFSLVRLCLYIFFPSWTTRAQNDLALLYTLREVHSSFIPHLLGPVPTLLPNFLCCSYVCLLHRSFWSRSSTCPEHPFIVFICPSGLSLNVTSSTGPVLCKVPPKVTFSYFRFFLTRCSYMWMCSVTCSTPFSPAGKQALDGLGHLCFAHLGSQCLAYSGSPVDVTLTCRCLAIIHLLEVWHSLF